MKASELQMDGVFYIQKADGSFESAHVWQWEIDSLKAKGDFIELGNRKWGLEQLSKDNKLFVNKDQPFKRVKQ